LQPLPEFLGAATFFVVPVLIYEKTWRHSEKCRYDPQHLGRDGCRWAGRFFYIPPAWTVGLLFLGLGIIFGWIGFLAGLLTVIVYWLILACICASMDGIFKAALYRYATTGKMTPEFPEEFFKNPWTYGSWENQG
jgi:hypothetical protein